MARHPIHRVAALAASLALVFAVVVPLHAHTCQWPSEGSGASGPATVEPLSDEAGPPGHAGPCLACTIDRRLQAPVTVGLAGLHALPTVARVALAPLPGRPVCGVSRLTPPRGPPLSS